MDLIKNKTQIIENGQTQLLQKARALALCSIEKAVDAADPKKLLHSKFVRKGTKLFVGDFCFDLEQFSNIYVIGGGKATGVMAQAIEDILGSYITSGFVNVPYGSNYKTKKIQITETNHPVPDQAGVEGTKKMMAIAKQATEKDLIVCLISGGGSSLMPMPHKNVTLEEKIEITSFLLKSGATIKEINIVRKHISGFKGGWLAKTAFPATILNLILSDVIGDSLDLVASGPTVPDNSTFLDTFGILEKYGLWTKTSAAIKNTILEGIKGNVAETPKADDKEFKNVYNVIIGNNKISSISALESLKQNGLNTLLLPTPIEGEARIAGTNLASIVLEIDNCGAALHRPAGIVAGGETIVTVKGKGIGGRNQEIALSAALKILDKTNYVIASISTDGIDGPTNAAGAIVDSYTISKAKQKGIDANEYLEKNDSHNFFSAIDDLIITGATGTNVNDISVIVML